MFDGVEREAPQHLGCVVPLPECCVPMGVFVRHHRHYEHRQHEQEIGYLYLGA